MSKRPSPNEDESRLVTYGWGPQMIARSEAFTCRRRPGMRGIARPWTSNREPP